MITSENLVGKLFTLNTTMVHVAVNHAGIKFISYQSRRVLSIYYYLQRTSMYRSNLRQIFKNISIFSIANESLLENSQIIDLGCEINYPAIKTLARVTERIMRE